MGNRRSIMYMLSFIAAALAGALAAHVSSSWTWPTIAFIVVVVTGAAATGVAEAHSGGSRYGPDAEKERELEVVAARGSGSVAIGGDNNGSIETHARDSGERGQGQRS
jgi:membrane protein implicated in regulation of membrane protease activity